MIDRQAFLKGTHQPDEKLLLAKVLDQADFSLDRWQTVFTDFLSPAEGGFITKVLDKIHDLDYCVYGGTEECERNRIALFPLGEEFCKEDFPIMAVRISFAGKFGQKLSHRDFLGAILGLGIDRSKVGDILLFDTYAICYADDEMASYICSHLEKVGKIGVKTETIEPKLVLLPEKKIQRRVASVASARADAVFGACFQISRGKAQQLIAAEKAFINWSVVKSPSDKVEEEDILSLRGYGRAKVVQWKGETKKGRLSVVLERYS